MERRNPLGDRKWPARNRHGDRKDKKGNIRSPNNNVVIKPKKSYPENSLTRLKKLEDSLGWE